MLVGWLVGLLVVVIVVARALFFSFFFLLAVLALMEEGALTMLGGGVFPLRGEGSSWCGVSSHHLDRAALHFFLFCCVLFVCCVFVVCL